MFPFFNRFRSQRTYHRRGFRMRGNTLVWLFVFFMIGLFLHYGGRTQPVVAFWNDVKGLLGMRSSRPDVRMENPYQAPEPLSPKAKEDKEDNVASDGPVFFP